jgi:hypothetical protein
MQEVHFCSYARPTARFSMRQEVDQDNLVALLRESSDARSNRAFNLVSVIDDGWMRRYAQTVFPGLAWKTRGERSSPFQDLRCCKTLYVFARAVVISETAG